MQYVVGYSRWCSGCNQHRNGDAKEGAFHFVHYSRKFQSGSLEAEKEITNPECSVDDPDLLQ